VALDPGQPVGDLVGRGSHTSTQELRYACRLPADHLTGSGEVYLTGTIVAGAAGYGFKGPALLLEVFPVDLNLEEAYPPYFDLFDLPVPVDGGSRVFRFVKAIPAECEDEWVVTVRVTVTKTVRP
jgi:hypothetical protein